MLLGEPIDNLGLIASVNDHDLWPQLRAVIACVRDGQSFVSKLVQRCQ
jgi:hypothetical protein